MSTNSRFLFDNEFASASGAAKKKAKELELPPAIYTEEQYQAALANAFEDGRQQGEQTAHAEKEVEANNLLENINQQVNTLNEAHSKAHQNVKKDAAEIAIICAQKLANTFMENSAVSDVTKLVEECLRDLIEEPRVVVRASELVCDSLKERIEALTMSSGFQGQLILLPDDTKSGANCRVEWADGGVEKDMTQLQEKVSEIVNRYVGSLAIPAGGGI